jgi:hypothetical protein
MEFSVCVFFPEKIVTMRLNPRFLPLPSLLTAPVSAGSAEPGDRSFGAPTALCVLGDDLYVCDSVNSRVRYDTVPLCTGRDCALYPQPWQHIIHAHPH